ncbi:MAG: DUF4150 domain-containing protein [Chloroflexi bacterium]|nr:DUF4150 domain-containing protein [Chloroflexota bacterium]
MSKPLAIAKGIAFAFPDVCLTTTPGGPVPIPYPNIAQLSQAQDVATDVVTGSAKTPVLIVDSNVSSSTGSSPSATAGVTSGTTQGMCVMAQGSGSVVYGPQSLGIVRFGDQTEQNTTSKQAPGNVQGIVLSAFPTVLVGD